MPAIASIVRPGPRAVSISRNLAMIYSGFRRLRFSEPACPPDPTSLCSPLFCPLIENLLALQGRLALIAAR